jgi:hypothetical protein
VQEDRQLLPPGNWGEVLEQPPPSLPTKHHQVQEMEDPLEQAAGRLEKELETLGENLGDIQQKLKQRHTHETPTRSGDSSQCRVS